MKIRNILILFLLTLSLASFAQTNPIQSNDLLLQGFGQAVDGTEFQYHSALPDITDCYLVRATDGRDDMTWKTEAVPANLSSDFAAFAWLAGMGSNMGKVPMHFSINGELAGVFETGMAKEWDLPLKNGATLSFRTSLVDGANDLFGFMILRVPKKLLKAGKPLELNVRGDASNSQAWYMTFLSPIPTGMTYKAFPAVYRVNGKKKQPLNIQVVYFGHPTPVSFKMNGQEIKKGQLNFGAQTFQLALDPVDYPLAVSIEMISEPIRETLNFTQPPVREWRVGFVQHSHTDIGYTRAQDEILAEQIRFIDYALDYCDATNDYPEEAKFRWTCEASFAVEDYLNSRPDSQIARLKKRIQEGRIEVSGMYFNFDEMPDEHTLAASLSPLKTFKKYEIPVTAAMQNDVNGIGWCFADYFGDVGIKYLNMGTHGHRALICFEKPTPFWWESPSGERILTFRAEHYMTGNTVFGIHTDNFGYFEEKLMTYLDDLGKKGYPYDFIHIQHSGYQTDNSPPSTSASEMIRMWNEKYDWPKLNTATVSDFFEELEANHADELPVYRAAWPDWWTDGFGSGAREAATSRAAHADLLAYHGALSMAGILGAKIPSGIDQRIDEATKALIFYDEHTFGHAQSVREPFGAGTMEQRSLKESYAWEAYRRTRRIGEEALGLLQGYIQREEVPIVAVFNTQSYQRSAVTRLYIDHQILPMGDEVVLVDENGQTVPAQAEEHRSDGSYWSIWSDKVPAYGMKKLRVEKAPAKNPAPVVKQSRINEKTIDVQNDYYYLQIDQINGVVSKLVDKELQVNVVDEKAPWGFGAFIYERLGARSELEAFHLENYVRKELDAIRFETVEEGPVWTAIRFSGETEACYGPGGFQLEIRLFNVCKQIDFVYTFRKKAIQDPEGIYLAFPFNIPNGKIYFDVPGGTVEAGVDQLPGSTTDWNTIQNFATIRNGTAQVIVTSPEAPLMQLGGINTGRFKLGATPEKTHIYGWPMNNYWTTNFNADQRGETTFTYSITSGPDKGNQEATRSAWNRRIPLLGRTLPPAITNAGTESLPENTSLISGIPENVLVISAIQDPEGRKITLHLREISGKNSLLNLQIYQHKNLEIQECNVIGNPLKTSENPQAIKALETKFLQINY